MAGTTARLILGVKRSPLTSLQAVDHGAVCLGRAGARAPAGICRGIRKLLGDGKGKCLRADGIAVNSEDELILDKDVAAMPMSMNEWLIEGNERYAALGY